MNADELRGTGRWTRLSIGARVALNVALACALALGVTALAGWPDLRTRIDLTVDHRNRLDSATERVIERLPEPVRIEVFFRKAPQPLTAAFGEAQDRMFTILQLAAAHRPDKIRLMQHDMTGAALGDSPAQTAMAALGVERPNVFVVHVPREAGDERPERKVIVPILGEVAEFDIGMPSRDPAQNVPPSLASFRGEEALVEALLQVGQTETPRALFSYGHGEPDLFGTDGHQLGKLHSALAADGFELGRWDPTQEPVVPEGTAVLAILSPRTPLSETAVEAVRAFVERGGALIATPAPNATDDLGEIPALVEPWGIAVGEGVVCMPYYDSATGRAHGGDPRVAELQVPSDTMNGNHPITESLRRAGRRVTLSFARPLEFGEAPDRGLLADLFGTPPESAWVDLPEGNAGPDWTFDPEREEVGASLLAATSAFPPPRDDPFVPENVGRERPESRVVVVGSHFLFANGSFAVNRDIALNAFNWATSREFRARISARSVVDRRFPVGADDSLFRVHVVGTYLLPALAVLAGILVARRRRLRTDPA